MQAAGHHCITLLDNKETVNQTCPEPLGKLVNLQGLVAKRGPELLEGKPMFLQRGRLF